MIAKKDRPGPVLVDIPKDVTSNKAEYQRQEIQPVYSGKDICEEDIETAIKLIKESEKTV